jgi:hypothetical protein
MDRQSPKKSTRINSGMDTRIRYADDMVLQGQKARGNNDGQALSATDIGIALANSDSRTRPIVVLDKRFLDLVETPLLQSGNVEDKHKNATENATRKTIAHAIDDVPEEARGNNDGQALSATDIEIA